MPKSFVDLYRYKGCLLNTLNTGRNALSNLNKRNNIKNSKLRYLNTSVVQKPINTITTFEDSDYKGLFYHLIENRNSNNDSHSNNNNNIDDNESYKYLLSFLSDPNKVARNDVAVIGWIPISQKPQQPELAISNSTLKNVFKENDKFLKFLHRVIADNVAFVDPQLQALAKYQNNGYLYT